MLNYGQVPDDPTVANLRSLNPNVNKFVGRWSEQLVRAKRCMEAAQQRMKHYADKRRRATPTFQVGDYVLLNVKNFRLQSGLCRKLAPRYVGPFRVLAAVRDVRALLAETAKVTDKAHPGVQLEFTNHNGEQVSYEAIAPWQKNAEIGRAHV